jgi:hypothetical protein
MKEDLEKKIMSEEYGRSLTGCFTAVIVVILTLLGIGVVACLLAI